MDTADTIAIDYGTIHGVITPWSYSYWGSPYSYSSWNYSPYYGWNSWRVVIITIHIVVVLLWLPNYGHGGPMVTMATIMEIPTQIKVKFTQAEEEDLSHLSAGRNVSPRRFTTHDGEWGTKTSPAIKQPNSEENISARSSKIYRGDIRNQEMKIDPDEIITPDPNDSRGNNRTPCNI